MKQLAFRPDPDAPAFYPKDKSLARGATWDVWRGFHARPSMEHLHLHVISSDLCGKGLKKKGVRRRWWHTLIAALPVIPPHARLLRIARRGETSCRGRRFRGAAIALHAADSQLPHSQDYYKQLLTQPLCSLSNTSRIYKNMPALKQVLLSQWHGMVSRQDRANARHGGESSVDRDQDGRGEQGGGSPEEQSGRAA